MAFDYRQPKDYFSTSLSVAASITDTTMRAPLFTGLDTDYGLKYLPLTLHDDAAGQYEIVGVVAHSASSDTVTVVRGREGTTARAWPSGTRVECAPSSYDVIIPRTTATLPSDPYLGMRVARTDFTDVVKKVKDGWVPDAGVAFAGDVGPNMNSVQPPNGATILMRAQYVTSFSTDASGNKVITWKNPFPNNTLAAWCTSVDFGHVGPFVVYSMSASQVGVTVYNGNATRTTQTGVSLMLMGLGW